jgi:PAS domain-containing protein
MPSLRLKEITTRLAKLEEQHSYALAIAGIGIWFWDYTTDVLSWDSNMLKVFDISEDEYTNNFDSVKKLIYEDDMPVVKKIVEESRNGAGSYDISYRIRLKNGDLAIIRSKGAAVKDSTGNVVGMTGICFRENSECPIFVTCEIREALMKKDKDQVEKYIEAIKLATISATK